MQRGSPIINFLSKIIKFHEKKATMIQIGDTTMIQNMKNVTGKSKFQSDLRILLKMQKMRFFVYTKFSHPLNQNPGVFSIKMCSRSFGTS